MRYSKFISLDSGERSLILVIFISNLVNLLRLASGAISAMGLELRVKSRIQTKPDKAFISFMLPWGA